MAAPEQVQIAFGKRVRELRLQRGYSQEKLGFDCDLSQTYISEVEQGKRNISLKNIAAVAAALDIGIADLFAVGDP